MQQVDIADAAMGLVERLVPCYLGVRDQVIPVCPVAPGPEASLAFLVAL